MSKEEILFKAVSEDMKKQGEPIDKGFDEISQTHEFKVLTSAMQEYADQEKEKVAVAFAEWKEHAYIFDAFKGKYISIYFEFECEKLSDLYKYFITNVYNK